MYTIHKYTESVSVRQAPFMAARVNMYSAYRELCVVASNLHEFIIVFTWRIDHAVEQPSVKIKRRAHRAPCAQTRVWRLSKNTLHHNPHVQDMK